MGKESKDILGTVSKDNTVSSVSFTTLLKRVKITTLYSHTKFKIAKNEEKNKH